MVKPFAYWPEPLSTKKDHTQSNMISSLSVSSAIDKISGGNKVNFPRFNMDWDRFRSPRNDSQHQWQQDEIDKNIGRREIILIRHGQYDI